MVKKTIVVVGSSTTDLTIKLDRLPRPGETVLGGRFVTAPGGKGANQAVAAARAGGCVSFVARIGSDSYGEQCVAGFIKDHIDVQHLVRDKNAPWELRSSSLPRTAKTPSPWRRGPTAAFRRPTLERPAKRSSRPQWW